MHGADKSDDIVLPFRDFHERYPIPMLVEASESGFISGHDEMPGFDLSESEMRSLLAYIDSLPPTTRDMSSHSRLSVRSLALPHAVQDKNQLPSRSLPCPGQPIQASMEEQIANRRAGVHAHPLTGLACARTRSKCWEGYEAVEPRHWSC